MVVSREIGFRAYHSHHGMLIEPCHGHDYVVRVSMQGKANEEGIVADFRAVKRLFKRIVVNRLNETNLDQILDFPTAENLSVWIWNKLDPFLPLHAIEVKEKPHSSVTYFGPSAT